MSIMIGPSPYPANNAEDPRLRGMIFRGMLIKPIKSGWEQPNPREITQSKISSTKSGKSDSKTSRPAIVSVSVVYKIGSTLASSL